MNRNDFCGQRTENVIPCFGKSQSSLQVAQQQCTIHNEYSVHGFKIYAL
jgi:hypothetical protein